MTEGSGSWAMEGICASDSRNGFLLELPLGAETL